MENGKYQIWQERDIFMEIFLWKIIQEELSLYRKIILNLICRWVKKKLENPKYKLTKQNKNDFWEYRHADINNGFSFSGNQIKLIEVLNGNDEWDEFAGFFWIRDKKHLIFLGPVYFLAEKVEQQKNQIFVLKADSSPKVHGRGYYGHYHDKNHLIHIWYGEPIIKHYDRLARAAQ